MVNEDLKIPSNNAGGLKRYIITFKRKDQREDKRSDKVEILKHLMGVGDFENYVNLSELRSGDKYHRYNKVTSSGRNEDDRYNPIAPNTETIDDINRYELPVVMTKLTPEQLTKVRKDPNVLMVEEEKIVYHHQELPWGISRVKRQSWNTSRQKGIGVPVAVIDSGILYTHEDLQRNYISGATFVPGTNSPIDEGGLEADGKSVTYHGTHIAGTIAAMDNDIGVVGVAPTAWLWSLKIFGTASEFTQTSWAMAAMEYAMNHDIWITNNSWGALNGFNSAQNTQWQLAYDKYGMINCAAAGNDGAHNMNPTKPTTQHYPSGYPGAIEISAIQEGVVVDCNHIHRLLCRRHI